MTRRPQPPLWTEVPLVLVHVAVVAGFARVFAGTSFALPLLGFTLGAHLLAISTRRLRVPVPIVVPLAVVGAAVAAAWILFPSTTTWGVPTGRTWTTAADAFAIARERYPVVVAPTKPIDGFLLASGLALWTAVWFADWTAHRIRATAEGLASASAIFVFCSIVGAADHELAASAGFLVALLAFVAVHRSERLRREQSWVPGGRATSKVALRGAAVATALAILGAILIAPQLPGADADAAISWRNRSRGDSSRVTVSPMVQLKKRLVDQSNLVAFEVRSSKRSYWRLTALDAFDGDIWSSSGEFRPAGDDLPTEAPPTGSKGAQRITQRFTIRALSAIWAPSAFEARSVKDADADLRWDPDSSTLIVESARPTTDGLSYSVVSQAPTYDPKVLGRSGARDPAAITSRYERLPAAFPGLARATAAAVTEIATSRYQKALALQDWFRSEFTYSTEVDASHSDGALVSFLRSRTGYCEQFAGAFAAMARSLGIPARVAVGFTPGNLAPDTPNVYEVRGRHAHAWPEVYFGGIGWVPFEPTPGRGIPGATNYTGVPAMQDESPSTDDAPTTTEASASSTDPGSDPSATSNVSTPEPSTIGSSDANRATSGDRGTGGWVPAALMTVLLAVGAAALIRRRRAAGARRRATPPADAAWARVARELDRRFDLGSDASETPLDLARRALPEIGDQGPVLLELADLVTESRWSATPLGDDAVARCQDLAARLVADLAKPRQVQLD